MDDFCAELGHEGMHGIYVGSFSRSEAHVVESDAPLNEAFIFEWLVGWADCNAGTRTDGIVETRRVHHRGQAEKWQQAAIKDPTGCEVAHGKLDVRNAIDLHPLMILVAIRPPKSSLVQALRPH